MAVLTVVTLDRDGLSIEDEDVAAASGGDSFANTGREIVAYKNAAACARTLTIDFNDDATVDGTAPTNKTVTLGAGETTLVGPFPTSVYNDTAGRVQLTYSAVTSLTVMVFRPSSE